VMGRARVSSSLVIRSVERSETVYEDPGQSLIDLCISQVNAKAILMARK
jgi:hypothetical protein